MLIFLNTQVDMHYLLLRPGILKVKMKHTFVIYLFFGSYSPCFAPIQHYQFNITTKYVILSLHWCIFIHPQWVQFYEDPICLLDPCFNILDCSSVYRYDDTRCSTFSITTAVILAQYKSILNSPDNVEIGFPS